MANDNVATDKSKLSWAILIFASLLLIGGLAALIPGVLPTSSLAACDDAIRDQLKAPSTYNRVDYYALGTGYFITYDAQNSFGVPLRNKASCTQSGSGYTAFLFPQGTYDSK